MTSNLAARVAYFRGICEFSHITYCICKNPAVFVPERVTKKNVHFVVFYTHIHRIFQCVFFYEVDVPLVINCVMIQSAVIITRCNIHIHLFVLHFFVFILYHLFVRFTRSINTKTDVNPSVLCFYLFYISFKACCKFCNFLCYGLGKKVCTKLAHMESVNKHDSASCVPVGC